MRTVLLGAAAAVLLVPAAGSWSAPRPVCNLVADNANDASLINPATPVDGPALDIRSVDVATGAKTLVVVLRMTTTNVASDPLATAGVSWDVTFKIGGVDHRFSRRVGPNGTVANESASTNGKPIPGVVVKTDGNAITWTVPRANVPKLKGRGAVLTSFFGSTSAPTVTYDYAPDNAVASTAKYADRTPSCVRAS